MRDKFVCVTVHHRMYLIVRKFFEQHTVADFRRLLDANLIGAMLLIHTFLPAMRKQNSGIIVHIGGFADGRLAFPYYSANVATRAGIFSFVESLNRELRTNGWCNHGVYCQDQFGLASISRLDNSQLLRTDPQALFNP